MSTQVDVVLENLLLSERRCFGVDGDLIYGNPNEGVPRSPPYAATFGALTAAVVAAAITGAVAATTAAASSAEDVGKRAQRLLSCGSGSSSSSRSASAGVGPDSVQDVVVLHLHTELFSAAIHIP